MRITTSLAIVRNGFEISYGKLSDYFESSVYRLVQIQVVHTMCWQLISHAILHTSYVHFTYTRGNVKYYSQNFIWRNWWTILSGLMFPLSRNIYDVETSFVFQSIWFHAHVFMIHLKLSWSKFIQRFRRGTVVQINFKIFKILNLWLFCTVFILMWTVYITLCLHYRFLRTISICKTSQ